MFKKILFSFLLLLCTYNIAVVAYRIFEPRPESVYTPDSSALDYDTLKQYIVSSGDNTTHLLFFCSGYDTDSIYIKETVLKTVEKDTSINIAGVIETVDVTMIDADNELTRLTNDWGITSIPAFAAVTTEDGEPVVLNTLEQSSGAVFTSDDIIRWIESNDISGTVSED